MIHNDKNTIKLYRICDTVLILMLTTHTQTKDDYAEIL